MLRWLLILLLLLNLAAAAWLRWGRTAAPPTARVPGVPELRLPDAATAASALPPHAARTAVPAPAGGAVHCAEIGPFATAAEMRTAFAALAPHVPGIQYRSVEVTVSRGWWVYLAEPDRARALATARALAARGLRDYYVITAGEQQNTVSLGLFQDPANARRRLARIRGMGFAATLRQRIEQAPQYFVQYQQPAQGPLAWQTIVPHADILQAHAIACD